MSRKMVSVVTGTYNRHDLLLEAIENVRAQTYRPLEMVIVFDGPDPDGMAKILEVVKTNLGPEDRRLGIRPVELGFWSSGLFTDSISAAPFMVAQLLARGDYQITLADDERFLDPDAIAKLVENLELYDADFAYSKVEITFLDAPGRKNVIGSNPPRCGTITQFLYRRDALDKGMLFRTHVGSGTDWDAVARTMATGARWVYVPELLATHRADK